MILCDTAPLFCLVDKSQPRHLAVKNFLKNNPSTLITTWSCFTEATITLKKPISFTSYRNQ